MSHLRPEARAQRHKKSDCRKGRHLLGEPQNIGAGIVRRVCEFCSTVTIDLTRTDERAESDVKPRPNVLSGVARQSEAT